LLCGTSQTRAHIPLEKVLKLGGQVGGQAGSGWRQLNEVRIGLLHLADIPLEVPFVLPDLLLKVRLELSEELGIGLGVETLDAPGIVAEHAIQELLGRAKEEHPDVDEFPLRHVRDVAHQEV
jgi:hypothetical protein